MKSVLIGTVYPWRGGIAQSNEALYRALKKKGQCKLISFDFLYPSFFFPNKSFLDTGKGPADIKPERIISSVNPFTWWKAASVVKKENPDIVIVRYWVPFLAPCYGTIVRLIKRSKKIKVICFVDHARSNEKRFIDAAFAKYVFKVCDSFLAFSDTVKDDLKTLVKNKKIIVSPLPLFNNFGKKVSKSLALNKLGLNKKQRHLLFFGFIRKYKGLDLLLGAMADERVKKLNIKLLVVGEFFDKKEEYLEQVQKLGISKNVVFRSEYVPGEEVKYYFCASDLIVQPYRDASQSAVTPVAYHFERPMLVTDVGGLAESVPDGVVGYVTKPNSKAIADCIIDFYNKNREKEFVKGVISEKKKFSWDILVKKIEQLAKS